MGEKEKLIRDTYERIETLLQSGIDFRKHVQLTKDAWIQNINHTNEQICAEDAADHISKLELLDEMTKALQKGDFEKAKQIQFLLETK